MLVVTGLATADGAVAQSAPVPTGVATVGAATPDAGVGTGAAVPTVLAAVGTPITLTVTLAPAGAMFTRTTSLGLSASLSAGGKAHGSFSPSTLAFPANTNSATFTVTYSAVDNGVIATVGGGKVKGTTLTSASSSPFDVLKELSLNPSSDPQFQTGVPIGNNQCSAATTESECAILVLANGAASSNVALSLGACTSGLGCMSGGQVVQFIADLGSNYSEQAPATLIIRCVKSLCKGKGVNSYTVNASFSASGALTIPLTPCVTKGVALGTDGNDYCTDYVQSHRDNAGDVLLYVLVTRDFRASTS